MIAGAGRGNVLDFDIENRPLTYWVPDRPTADITAIAWMWVGDHDTLTVRALGDTGWSPSGRPMSQEQMLEEFVEAYNEADLVTGHYIRKHDLPIINGALYELDMPLLSDKLTCDTKLDMFTKADVPATQEWLLEQVMPECPLGMALEKFHMTQTSWREANRLTPEGIALTKRRVMSDVHAHSHLREAMLARGWLGAPRVWSSGGGDVAIGRITSAESK